MTDTYQFKEMETDRLRLIKLAPEHVDHMYAYASREDTVRFMSWKRHESKEQTARFIELSGELYEGEMLYDWAIWHREDRRMIGTIGLHGLDREINGAEMGYIIARPYWGQGLVPEAGRRILRFCFDDLKLSVMKAYCDRENRGSERVMEKLGMTYGGIEPYQLRKAPEPVMYRWYFIKSPLEDRARGNRNCPSGGKGL
ncbi:MAG: GNAT family N-acetyltransferase [Spirochaetales bacterium]|nr:GNAT family N-acetyltransferase [Spirochaetales bacterium]